MKPKEALSKFFGYKIFRPGQEEIINAIMSSENVVAVLPTGAGKSICYQIPALISENFSVVISPLIALMKDQVDSLNKKEIISAFINSSLEFYEVDHIISDIAFGKIKLLYVAPERLESIVFAEKLKNLNINYLFVDEAHCISEWGHNFRPSYRKIKEFVEYVGVKKISSFTATATPEVVKDIAEQLNLKNPKIFVMGFERENLSVNVFQTKNKKEKVVELLTNFSTPAIIYCASRRNAEEIASYLRTKKISCSYYHAGMNSIQRKHVQDNFIKGKNDVISATNAFGMGIDKKDIRLVLHYNLPSSIENYYQEIGRAGRDGKDSIACLLYDESDVKLQQYLISQSYPNREMIVKTYDAICNYGNVALGNISEKEIPINIDYISSLVNKNLSKGMLSSILKTLEGAEYLKTISEFEKKSYITFHLDKESVKKFVKNHSNDIKQKLILVLIREYGGELFNRKVHIQLHEIAKLIELSEDEIDEILMILNNSGIIQYDKPTLTESVKMLKPRIKAEYLQIDFKKINDYYFNAQSKLDTMINFVFTKECKFKFILKYFGEEVSTYKCNKCCNCVDTGLIKDNNFEYLKELILRTTYEFEDGLKENDLINALLGKSKSVQIRKATTFGCCSAYSKFELQSVLHNLISTALLKKEVYKKKVILLTNKGKDYLMTKGIAIEKDAIQDYEKNLELLHLLKEVRTKASNKFNQPKYLVCSDDVLKNIAYSFPTTKIELLKINGFNERMFTKIGEEILEVINEFDESKKSSESLFEKKEKKLPKNVNDTYALLKQGYSLNEIASLQKINEAVISMQIETILEVYPETEINHLIEKKYFEIIAKKVNEGLTNLKELKKQLPAEISYAHIRIALAKLKAT